MSMAVDYCNLRVGYPHPYPGYGYKKLYPCSNPHGGGDGAGVAAFFSRILQNYMNSHKILVSTNVAL